MSTKGSFTRDEWNHLFRLFIIMIFSMFACNHFFVADRKESAMSKRTRMGLPEKVNTWGRFSIICKRSWEPRKIFKIWNWRNKDQRIDVEIIHVFDNESIHSSCTGLHWEFGSIQEHELRGNPEFVRYHSEVDSGSFWRNSECETIESRALSNGRDLRCLMIKWSSGQKQTYVFIQTVLCLVNMSDPSEAITRWEGQMAEFRLSVSYEELLGIDEERIEFEWNIS